MICTDTKTKTAKAIDDHSQSAATVVGRAWLKAAISAVVVIAFAGQLQQLFADEETIHVASVTLTLAREAEISAHEAGLLAAISAKEGRPVKEGDIVAQLNNEQQLLNVKAAQLTLKVAQMRADDTTPVETAKAQLQEARSSRQVKEIALKISEAEAATDVPVRIASAEAKLRELELQRAEGARQSFKGSVSEAQIDRLKTSVAKGELEIQQAETDHQILQMKPDAERATIAQKDDEIRRYEALLSQGEKELSVAKVNQEIHNNEVQVAEFRLEQRNVRAPFDGVIVEVQSSQGEWVEQGMPILRIVDLNVLRAEGFLPIQKASLDLVGCLVTIHMTSGTTGRKVTGKITFVSPEVDPINQQVRFWAEFQNSATGFLPGMNAAMSIEPKTKTANADVR